MIFGVALIGVLSCAFYSTKYASTSEGAIKKYMNNSINFKNKKNTYKLIVSIILVLIVWLFLRPKTPQEQAISKYIKANSNSYTLTMIVSDSNILDPQYGRQYYVNGVIGDFADVNFFYLTEDSDGWKVTSCGTGP